MIPQHSNGPRPYDRRSRDTWRRPSTAAAIAVKATAGSAPPRSPFAPRWTALPPRCSSSSTSTRCRRRRGWMMWPSPSARPPRNNGAWSRCPCCAATRAATACRGLGFFMEARTVFFHVVGKEMDSAATARARVDGLVVSAMAAVVSRSSIVVVAYSSAGEVVMGDGLRSQPGLSGNLRQAGFLSVLGRYGEGVTRGQRRPPHPRGIHWES